MRPPLKTILVTLLAAAGAALMAAVIVIYAGAYDVGADDEHWGLTRWVLEHARIQSIRARAARIIVPPKLDDPAQLAMGVEHFAAHCAVCHGAPGVPRGDIAHGLYPKPPDLGSASKNYSDAELFWILKHGIKMTGMPSWADHGDDELWATVAFIKKLGAGMSEAEYAKLVMQNATHGMMHHPGETMPGMTPGAVPPADAAPHQIGRAHV